MILVSFGCDRCGAVESCDFPDRGNYGRGDDLRAPHGWRLEDDGKLVCDRCAGAARADNAAAGGPPVTPAEQARTKKRVGKKPKPYKPHPMMGWPVPA